MSVEPLNRPFQVGSGEVPSQFRQCFAGTLPKRNLFCTQWVNWESCLHSHLYCCNFSHLSAKLAGQGWGQLTQFCGCRPVVGGKDQASVAQIANRDGRGECSRQFPPQGRLNRSEFFGLVGELPETDVVAQDFLDSGRHR